MKHEDFVTYEQAINLKALGFEWECFGYYLCDDKLDIGRQLQKYNSEWHLINLGYVAAPTLSQAQKWLREVKGIIIELRMHPLYKNWFGKVFDLKNYPNINFVLDIDLWDTYEESLSDGINKALEILKQN